MKLKFINFVSFYCSVKRQTINESFIKYALLNKECWCHYKHYVLYYIHLILRVMCE